MTEEDQKTVDYCRDMLPPSCASLDDEKLLEAISGAAIAAGVAMEDIYKSVRIACSLDLRSDEEKTLASKT